MEAELLRVNEFCKCYATSRASFYREVKAQRLSIVKRGRTTLITRAEANRWLATICKNTSSSKIYN